MGIDTNAMGWDLRAADDALRNGESAAKVLAPTLDTDGELFLLFGQLPEQSKADFRTRLHGADWDDVQGQSDIRRLRYSTVERLERVLDLVCSGLPPAERDAVRASLLPSGIPQAEVIFQAAQNIEYLSELHNRVRQNWLATLMQHPSRFFNVFQPLVDLRHGRVMAYEMLIRAHDPDKDGVIGAWQIVSAATESKLLYALDQVCRDVAVRTASRVFPAGTGVFINFMPNAILDPLGSLDKSVAMCEACGLSPSKVVFEVIETERIQDVEYLAKLLNEYRQQGFKIALDDLGAGFSGLNYLHQLMPEYIKLDRELVDGASESSSQRVLISKLTEAAHDLGIRVVAEGVETFDDYCAIRDLGADIVQGYFFARPSPDRVFGADYNLLEAVLSAHAEG